MARPGKKMTVGEAGPSRAVEERDAYTALAGVDAAIVTGATGDNHADLTMFYIEP